MKKLILPAFCLLMSLVAVANNTTVIVKFKGLKPQTVEVGLPINGTYFPFIRNPYTISDDSTITILMQVDKTARIVIYGYLQCIVEPGISKIVVDSNKKDNNKVTFDDKNLEGQILYNNLHFDFYQEVARRYFRKDSTANGVRKFIETDKAKTIFPFDSLLKTGKISKNFYDHVKTDVDVMFASILAHVPLQLYLNARRKGIKPYLTADFEKLWKQVYINYPVNNVSALKSPDYYDYATDYSGTYLNLYLLNENTKEEKKTEGDYLIYKYNQLQTTFGGLLKEYMLAYFVAIEMLQERFQPELLTLFERFKKSYPKSKYTDGITPMAEKIKKYQMAAAKQFTGDQRIIEGYEKINSINELLNLYKGKTAYIDIWATWCGPCKREFVYSNDLKAELKKSNIDMLYISMDDAETDQKWKDMIKYFNLAGEHIRVNDSLKQDLINKLWKGEGYAIPRYLIIKDGKIINDDALRPSDKKNLYKQLNAAVN